MKTHPELAAGVHVTACLTISWYEWYELDRNMIMSVSVCVPYIHVYCGMLVIAFSEWEDLTQQVHIHNAMCTETLINTPNYNWSN